MRHRLHQRLAERGEQAGDGNRPVILWPRLTVHPDPELALRGEGNPHELDFEVFIARIILDRNSQVRFHKLMKILAVRKVNCAQYRARTLPNQ